VVGDQHQSVYGKHENHRMLPEQVRVVMEAMGSYWITLATQLIHFTACDTVEALTAYVGLAPMLGRLGTSVWYRPSTTP
jgi:hypothetical protein